MSTANKSNAALAGEGGVGEKEGGKSLLGQSLDFSLQPRRSCWLTWILGSYQELALVPGLSAYI